MDRLTVDPGRSKPGAARQHWPASMRLPALMVFPYKTEGYRLMINECVRNETAFEPVNPLPRSMPAGRVMIGGLPAQLEHWSWDGAAGKSLIFAAAQVAHLDDAALAVLVLASGLAPAECELSISRRGGVYVFVSVTGPAVGLPPSDI